MGRGESREKGRKKEEEGRKNDGTKDKERERGEVGGVEEEGSGGGGRRVIGVDWEGKRWLRR